MMPNTDWLISASITPSMIRIRRVVFLAAVPAIGWVMVLLVFV
jgi:hypothetical protein